MEVKGEIIEVLPEHDDAKRRQLADELNGRLSGHRRGLPQVPGATDEPVYTIKDESDLTLLGYMAFLDPPKETAPEALKRLNSTECARQDPDGRQRDMTRLYLQEWACRLSISCSARKLRR